MNEAVVFCGGKETIVEPFGRGYSDANKLQIRDNQ